MAQFDYKIPLSEGQIRLLKLDWGEAESELVGRLLIRALDVDDVQYDATSQAPKVTITMRASDALQAEKYEALSYPWGVDQPEDCKIKIAIGDDREYRTFNIKRNLELALRLLRSHIKPPNYSKFLWVDAMCINQNNIPEKSIQIPLMAEIYSRAENVCVWLGEPTDNSDQAIQFVHDVLQHEDFDKLLTRSTSPQWEAFYELLKRRWFRRRWIVQEIALARSATLYCGQRDVSWDDFADVVSLVSSRKESFRRYFKSLPDYDNHPDRLGYIEKLGASWLASKIDSLLRKAEDGTVMEHMFCLEAVMSNLALFQASNPRDTLYAILWLANDVRPEKTSLNNPRVFYSRENTPELSNDMDRAEHVETPLLIDGPHQTTSPQSPNRSHTSFSPAPSILQDLDTSRRGNDEQSEHAQGGQPGKSKQNLGLVYEQTSLQTPRPEPPAFKKRKIYENGLKPMAASSRGNSRRNSACDSTLKAQNMVYNGPDLTIPIDYGKSIYDVCKDFLVHVFSRFGYIDMMCRPWAPEPSIEHPWDPPSWMVTTDRVAFILDIHDVYRREGADPLVGTPGVDRKRNYNASGQTRAFPRQDKSGERSYPPKIGPKCNLFVKGFRLAQITEIAGPASDGKIPKKWLDFVGWNPTEGFNPPDRFWRTLVGNRGTDEISDPPRYFRRECKLVFKRAFKGNQPRDLRTSDELTHGSCPDHKAEFLRRVQSVTWNKRLVRGTCSDKEKKQELFGLAPGDVEIGDLICILYGCCVPVILRSQNLETFRADKEQTTKQEERQDRGPETQSASRSKRPTVHDGTSATRERTPGPGENWFKFIGECYVHGMMNGEVFSHKKKYHGDSLDKEEFEIR